MEKNSGDMNGLVSALRGLSACKFEASNLRSRLVDMANKIVASGEQSSQEIHTQALVDGLVGLSQCNYKPDGSPEFVSSLSNMIGERIDDMTFLQKLEALHSLVTLDI